MIVMILCLALSGLFLACVLIEGILAALESLRSRKWRARSRLSEASGVREPVGAIRMDVPVLAPHLGEGALARAPSFDKRADDRLRAGFARHR
jgi:hypothetical protein